jgi:hypothetical protein
MALAMKMMWQMMKAALFTRSAAWHQESKTRQLVASMAAHAASQWQLHHKQEQQESWELLPC